MLLLNTIHTLSLKSVCTQITNCGMLCSLSRSSTQLILIYCTYRCWMIMRTIARPVVNTSCCRATGSVVLSFLRLLNSKHEHFNLSQSHTLQFKVTLMTNYRIILESSAQAFEVIAEIHWLCWGDFEEQILEYNCDSTKAIWFIAKTTS